jgi:hypothetical protein
MCLGATNSSPEREEDSWTLSMLATCLLAERAVTDDSCELEGPSSGELEKIAVEAESYVSELRDEEMSWE